MNNIKKLIQMLKEYQKSYIGHDYIFYDIKFCNPQVQMCIEALEKQLNGCWIPVSERLPEKEDIYQVTIKYKNFAGIHLTVRTAIYENKKWNIHGPQPVISNIKIIAWQPLPEPYKEEENE